MSGISTGSGLFSGIDTASLIDQLMKIEARPKVRFQQRVTGLQLQQSAILDINARLSAVRTSISSLRTGSVFSAMSAATSASGTLSASAAANAAAGSYSLLVDRLASTQKLLSQGFADRETSGVGLTRLTFESERARLDRDVALADLNGGAGIVRGKLEVADSGGRSATIDLSKAATVGDVLDAFNNSTAVSVRAFVRDGRIIVEDRGGGQVEVSEVSGGTTAASLGIRGSAVGRLTGSKVYTLAAGSSLASLNDGNGVSIKSVVGESASNFSIVVDDGGGSPKTINVNVGDVYQTVNNVLTKTASAVTSVGGVIDRINQALDREGVTTVRASINSAGDGLRLAATTGTPTITVNEGNDRTARDLGLVGTSNTGTLNGTRVLSALNSTLLRTLNGGAGIAGDGALNFRTKDGTSFTVNANLNGDVSDLIDAIESASGTLAGGAKRVTVSLGANGTGLVITDNSAGGNTTRITGTSGSDSAASLGISTGTGGTTSASVSAANLQRQYVSRATTLASLNAGKGVGTGTFRLTDSSGAAQTVTVGSDIRTVGEFIDLINSRGMTVKARVNANGDGIEMFEDSPSPGTTRIRVEDTTGIVARSLNLAGEAAGTGGANTLNGTFERTVDVLATDTLSQVVTKINSAKVGISASILRDGNGATPFRLSLVSENSGSAGRFLVATSGTSLNLSTAERGDDARVFLGSSDPARAILFTSSTNTLDSAIDGVTVNLLSTSASPVELTVSRNTEAVESALDQFVKAFNTAIDRIDTQTRYDATTQKSGPLLGDTTAISLRRAMFDMIQAPTTGATGRYSRLTQIGFKITSTGDLTLDKDKLRTAMAEDPDSVRQLVLANADSGSGSGSGSGTASTGSGTSTTTQQGVLVKMESLMNRYLDTTNGILTRRSKGFDSLIQRQQESITALDGRLSARRTVLENQFLAMEKAIAQLRAQQSSLGALGG